MTNVRAVFILALTALLASEGNTARLKDLVSIEGVRPNQLVGYGIVVGLAGKGDSQQTIFPYQSLANVLERMGVVTNPTQLRVKNTAAVMVTALLPAFAQPGMPIDTTVSSIGDASTLQGGILVLTSLRAADGAVYAVAQGSVVTGGFLAGRAGTTQTVNHPTVGRIPNGALVERPAPSVEPKSVVRLQLRDSDFTTAARIAEELNKKFSSGGKAPAQADNAGLVSIAIPPEYTTRTTEFLAELESLSVDADGPARVVINERTGTIVLGKEVRIRPVAILHGNLNVEIQTKLDVSQPAPLAQGTTEVVPETTVGAKEEKARSVLLREGATIEELVRAMAAIGSTPRDIIAILQTLRSAGALDADIEVI